MGNITIESLLGPKPKTIESVLGPPPQTEPIAFDFTQFVEGWANTYGQEDLEERRQAAANTFAGMTRHYAGMGYNAYAALNRGASNFFARLDAAAQYISEDWQDESRRDRLFDALAKLGREKADHYQARAEEIGIGFFGELVSEAVGGAIPGIVDFVVSVGSLGGIPAAAAMQQHREVTGEEDIAAEFTEGLLAAAKYKTLDVIFKAMGPLRRYLKMPATGAVMGVSAAGEAPEEMRWKEFWKGVGTGALYGYTSPGGKMGLSDVTKQLTRHSSEKLAQQKIKDTLTLSMAVDEISMKPGDTWEDVRSKNGLVVALKDKDGKTYIGGPNDTQSTLAGRLDIGDNVADFGFVTKNGHYIGEKDLKALYVATNGGVQVGTGAKGVVDVGEVGTQEPTGEPVERESGFMKTAMESERTAERTKEMLEEIKSEDPFIYYVKRNAEATAEADAIINKGEGVAQDYAYSESPLNATKGATFIRLIERAQERGDYAKEIELMEAFSYQLREAGRFVQIASLWAKASPEGMLKQFQKTIDAVNNKRGLIDAIFGGKKFELTKMDKVWITSEMNRINKMPPGLEKNNALLSLVDRFAVRLPPTASELIDAFRYQNMLSGIRTHERNTLENLVNTYITRPADLMSRGFTDYWGSVLFGKDRQYYMKDTLEYYKSTINALPTAITAAKQAWRMEVPLDKPDLGFDTSTLFQRARAKQMPKYLTIVQRAMESQDRFFMALITAGEYAINVERGMEPVTARSLAEQVARQYLYRENFKTGDAKLSGMATALRYIGDKMMETRKSDSWAIRTISSYAVPFLRTPIDKGIWMIEHSPLGLLRKNGWDADNIARAVTGSMITGMGALTAMIGDVTWTAPTDQKEKDWFYATGRKPFSVKVGERWVPVWYLGPFALAFALPAAIKYYMEDSKQSLTDDVFTELIKIGQGTARFIASQSSVQNLGTLFAMLEGDLTFTAEQIGASMVSQLMALESFTRQLNTVLDPVYRKAKGFRETLWKNIPFFSQRLPAYQQPFGEISEREFANAFLPYDIGVVKPEYESMYPFMQMQMKYDFLLNKLDAITREQQAGERSPEDAMEAYQKIFDAFREVAIKGGQ